MYAFYLFYYMVVKYGVSQTYKLYILSQTENAKLLGQNQYRKDRQYLLAIY